MESLDAKGLSSPELSHGVGEVTLPCRGVSQAWTDANPRMEKFAFHLVQPSASFTFPAKENRPLQGIIARALSPTPPLDPAAEPSPSPLRSSSWVPGV